MTDDELHAAVERVAALAEERGRTVAVAESLTCGSLATRLGAGPSASTWFAGGVVAYQEQVKFRVLGVREGPVVTAECATQMARGVRELLSADLAVSATGVGGPDPSEGRPAGTVFLALDTAAGTQTRELHLDGDPDDVLRGTVEAAVEALEGALRGGS